MSQVVNTVKSLLPRTLADAITAAFTIMLIATCFSAAAHAAAVVL